MLLFAVAALHRRRDERPIAYAVCVALLANTNVHSLCIAALIGVVYLLDLRRHIGAIAIMLAGGVASLFQIWPAPDAMVHGVVSNFHPEAPLLALRNAFLTCRFCKASLLSSGRRSSWLRQSRSPAPAGRS
jgi:hypothetical protein